MKIRGAIFWLLIWGLWSCNSTPEIKTFDHQNWQKDANGCQGIRLAQLSLVLDQQHELMGWTEQEMIHYLGPPDYRELYVRNQKFLIYYIEPSQDCDSLGKSNPLRMYLRFDALGDSKELSLKNQ